MLDEASGSFESWPRIMRERYDLQLDRRMLARAVATGVIEERHSRKAQERKEQREREQSQRRRRERLQQAMLNGREKHIRICAAHARRERAEAKAEEARMIVAMKCDEKMARAVWPEQRRSAAVEEVQRVRKDARIRMDAFCAMAEKATATGRCEPVCRELGVRLHRPASAPCLSTRRTTRQFR
mmetsp:Transcript_101909/g.287584  ORF Transcript_101909/g.287584 Transcript_101909/m.287584 type:complete len:184 (-) Transcript_101909:104-655(-)